MAAPAVALGRTSSLTKVRDIDVCSSPEYYCGPGPGGLAGGGEILLAFRRSEGPGHAHPDVEVCLMRSRDGGSFWSEPTIFEYGAVTNPNLARLPGGVILYITHNFELVTPATYRRLVAYYFNSLADATRRRYIAASILREI